MSTTNVGRRANGPQVYRTPARRAHDIALSILAHRVQGRTRDITRDYGIVDAGMIAAIAQAVEQRQRQQAAA